MSGADDLMHAIARLSTALDRIGNSVPRLLVKQARADQQPAQALAQPGSATPNADIAARLDSLIEQLRVALSTTAS